MRRHTPFWDNQDHVYPIWPSHKNFSNNPSAWGEFRMFQDFHVSHQSFWVFIPFIPHKPGKNTANSCQHRKTCRETAMMFAASPRFSTSQMASQMVREDFQGIPNGIPWWSRRGGKRRPWDFSGRPPFFNVVSSCGLFCFKIAIRCMVCIWLMVWLPFFDFSQKYWVAIIIPIDELHHFSEGWVYNHQPELSFGRFLKEGYPKSSSIYNHLLGFSLK